MELKIDIRIGTIHIQNGELEFINLGGGDGIYRASFEVRLIPIKILFLGTC